MLRQKKHQKHQLTGHKKSPKLLGQVTNINAKICGVQFLVLL